MNYLFWQIFGVTLAFIAILVLLFLFVLPSLLLRPRILKDVSEGNLNEDATAYIGDAETISYLTSYELVRDPKTHRSYCHLDYTDKTDSISVIVILFDRFHHPIGVREVTIQDVSKPGKDYIPVSSKTKGLYVRVLSVNDLKFDSPQYYGYLTSDYIRFSVVLGLITWIFAILYNLLIWRFTNNIISTELYPLFFLLLYSFLGGLAASIGSYFYLAFRYKKITLSKEAIYHE